MNDWKWLTDKIPTIRKGGISMAKLASELAMEPRDLRRCIEWARKSGELICSSSYGYYTPTTLPEFRAHARYMLSRLDTTWNCLLPFINIMIQMENEQGLNGVYTKEICLHLTRLQNAFENAISVLTTHEEQEG